MRMIGPLFFLNLLLTSCAHHEELIGSTYHVVQFDKKISQEDPIQTVQTESTPQRAPACVATETNSCSPQE